MASILDLLGSQLSPDALQQMGGQLGLDQDQVARALPSAIAVLTSGLARNAAQPDGAENLARALDQDHDGDLLDNLSGFLTGAISGDTMPRAANGAGILRHVLGADRNDAEVALSRSAGIDAGQAGKLLMMLAPLIMGALGKAKRRDNLGPRDLGSILGREQRQVRGSMPSGLGGLAASFLDADGDGDLKDDMARMGAGLLGKLFSKR